ncbi:MAG: 2-oxo acid dehydrogenase subunit E2 [Bacteroidetes bacterium]|jgi:2-oxoglutarate dehydrogenase E2 component (dihydrolipoamide succinyltransferase)|nr:2-oxo acid dehydrogenase subunit E2 [Bacteroidota bacterium]
MALYYFKLPAMGEGIIEATITSWHINEGDTIDEDEIIVEVATDKVDSEVPVPVSGKVKRIYYQEGDSPAIGEIIAQLETDDDPEEIEQGTPDDDAHQNHPVNSAQPSTALYKPEPQYDPITVSYEIPVFISQYAKERGVRKDELMRLKHEKNGEELVKQDIIQYIESGRSYQIKNSGNGMPRLSAVETEHSGSHTKKENKDQAADITLESSYEVVEMDRMRKILAEHMVTSKRTSPHVTSFIEADVTDMVNWRERVKNSFFEKQQQKLTYTPLIVEAVTAALLEYSDINVSVVGDKIIRKKEINIGIATALKSGNLIVPVIKNANDKNLADLALAVNDLTARARNNKLNPFEIKGGTFTITNLGNFDNISGTPIINQPEVAILAVGAIKRKPAVVNTELGETIGIRSIVMLSLSYDHRVVDGALGGMFLKSIARNLESFDINRSV